MQKRMMISACVFLLGFLIFGCNSATTATPTTATPTTAVATSTQMPTTDQPTTATAITTQSLEELMSEQGLQTMSSLEVVFYMGNGTNLGNTMEAFGRTTIGTDQDVSAYETLWGQPITTAAMISGMKAAGFDTLRIPVAWTNTMDIDNDDYTIRQDYLERVAEIVNYALDAEMFVIINDHWDGGWWGMFGASSQSIRNKAWAIYDSIWTQVGNYFKDYSYRLIFESANEELGNRLNDAINEINGVLTENECYEQANAINQEFVDIIRSQGGKNADRFLLIAGYNTDIEMTYDNRFNMPTDSATDKLLLSVHYYTPWTYCGSSGDASWGTENHYNTQNNLLEKMTKYTDMGYGIVFGEFAVLTKSDGSLKNNTVDFIRNFLDNCDKYGYVPVLWDTNAFFIREELEIFDEELASLYHERSFTQQFSLSYAEVISQAETSMAHYLQLAIQRDLENPNGPIIGDEVAVAWLMYTSNDWSVTYSVGDAYDPTLSTNGIVATDVIIEGPGTYTIGLDFTGTAPGYASSTAFSAIGLANGELLFPGYIIQITQILVNGQPYSLKGLPYTTSDDGICTRVNLYNEWVRTIPPEARVLNQVTLPYVSAVVIDRNDWGSVTTIQITFNYINPNA